MSRENIAPAALQRIVKELKKLCSEPTEGIKIILNEADFTDVKADIEGPEKTPYEGGVFRCKLVISSEFPSVPPRGVFLTKIFHPNVSTNGEICVNTLKKDWSPDMGMAHILQVIRCLLIHPFPDSALNEEASKLFLESYDEYYKRASLYTKIHATTSSASSSSESNANNSKTSLAPTSSSEENSDTTTTRTSTTTPPPEEEKSSPTTRRQHPPTAAAREPTPTVKLAKTSSSSSEAPKKSNSSRALKRL